MNFRKKLSQCVRQSQTETKAYVLDTKAVFQTACFLENMKKPKVKWHIDKHRQH